GHLVPPLAGLWLGTNRVVDASVLVVDDEGSALMTERSAGPLERIFTCVEQVYGLGRAFGHDRPPSLVHEDVLIRGWSVSVRVLVHGYVLRLLYLSATVAAI